MDMVSLGILILVSALILISSFRRMPGIGVILALVIIGITIWLRGDGLAGLGLFPPEDWMTTVWWSLLLGIVLAVVSTLLVEPFSDWVTKSETDHSAFDGLRGNLKGFLVVLVTVWLLVAVVEEVIFRGYMMGEIAVLTGTSNAALALNVIVTSILFGLAHGYQGRSGVLSTGLLGAVMGILFITSGFNLWLPILTHGFIDTVGLFLIYINADKAMKQRVKLFG